MTPLTANIAIDRHCRHSWRRASKNTAWRRLGCAIGSFLHQRRLPVHRRILADNGDHVLTWRVVPIMLAAGFVTPVPCNYWRLKALGKACH